jgi:hypothetical protein
MAAGLGFKDFVTGEVLTAADVDGYLMQGIWVFANATARDAAVTSPQEGNFAYLKDTNTTTYYTGSAWTNLDTTGMVNPMTTTGDTIYSSSGSTPARLGIGSTGQVLTVSGGLPSWANPSSGGMTLLDTVSLSGSSTTSATFSSSYEMLMVYVEKFAFNENRLLRIRLNGDSGSNYVSMYFVIQPTSVATANSFNASAPDSMMAVGNASSSTGTLNGNYCKFYLTRPKDTTQVMMDSVGWSNYGNNTASYVASTGVYDSSAAITSITFTSNGGTMTAGTAYIYGVK